MNSMSQRDLQQHVSILGWLYVVANALALATGAFVFLLLTGIGAATGERQALTILGVVGTSVGLLLTAIGAPGLVAGYGLLTHKPWARVLALVLGILGLVNFPVGTAVGIYAFWVLTQPVATDYFAAPA